MLLQDISGRSGGIKNLLPGAWRVTLRDGSALWQTEFAIMPAVAQTAQTVHRAMSDAEMDEVVGQFWHVKDDHNFCAYGATLGSDCAQSCSHADWGMSLD